MTSPQSNKPGDYIWYELLTTDGNAAQRFYASILGWTFADSGQPNMDYRIVNAGEHMDMGPMGKYQFIRHGGLIGAIMPNPGSGSPRWNQYFRVQNIDVAKAAVEKGGGKVTQGPDEIPRRDFSMNCVDPHGVPFGLVGRRTQESFAQ